MEEPTAEERAAIKRIIVCVWRVLKSEYSREAESAADELVDALMDARKVMDAQGVTDG